MQPLKHFTAILEEIKKAERQATGHIDYTRKFSLYCSWLVSG